MISQLIIAVALWPCLIASGQNDEVQEVEQAVDYTSATIEFTLNLMKTLSSTSGKNVVFSPTSIDILLALLQQGASGETAKQLTTVLHRGAEQSKLIHPSILQSLSTDLDSENRGGVTVKIATKAYIQRNFSVKENFLRAAQDEFRAEVDLINFSDPDIGATINNWVSNVTEGRITNVVQNGVLSADTVLVLISAIFFDAKWKYPFSPSFITHGPFYTSSTSVIEGIPFMTLSKPLLGGEDAATGLKWIELPYKGRVFSMYVFLPLQDNYLDETLRKLKGSDFKKIFDSQDERYVKLKLPKFTLRQTIPLEQALMKLGLKDLFTDQANFSGMTSSPIKVSNALHECFLRVDEAGTQATAATTVFATTLSLQWHQQEELKFFVTQPFMFAIIDKINKVPLFVGKVVNPR